MPRLIAVDLGSHAVKVSVFSGSNRRWEFDERHSELVPQDGDLPTLDARLAALDALLDQVPTLKRGGGDVVAAVLPGARASFHRVRMPFTDRAQIEKTLPFAIEAEVPFDLEDMVLGWRITGVTDETDVLATLVRHEHVVEWVAALSERDLDPAVVHIDGDVLGYFAGSTVPEPAVDDEVVSEPAVAVVDIGHLHTLVSVVRHREVEVCRTINVGGHAFTRAIQRAAGCSWEDAEGLKHGTLVIPGQQDDEVTDPGARRTSGYALLPPNVRQAVDGAIGLLLAEVRATLIKAEDALGCEIAEVRLVGGSARISELWDYLAQDLGVSVGRARSADGARVPLPYAVSHGLGMYASGQAAGDAIDLRSGDLAYRGGTDTLRAILTYGFAGGTFFAMAAVLMFAFQYVSLMREEHKTQELLKETVVNTFPEVPPSSVRDGSMAVALMREFTEEEVQRAEILNRGVGGVPPTVDTLYALTAAFPPNDEVRVELSELSITPSTISFLAETDGYASSAKVEERLQASERFKTATKGDEDRLANGRVKFPISIALDSDSDVGEGEAPAEEAG